MAPKQPAALKNPPPADTSSEEEEESDEEVLETQTKTPQKPDSSEDESDQSSSDEEEEEDKENKKPDQKSDSDSEDEDEEVDEKKKPDSGSEEEDGSDTESADTAPLKVEEPKVVVKPKPVEVVIASPAVKSALSNQKKGKASASGADEKKSPAFTRVFGDDDEVAVLNGMDEFRKKTGRDPNVDRDGFFEFMKKSLKIEVSKSQLMDKVRRLKKKYQNHEKKGKDPVITKPHELKLYELSKKVWSGDVGESAAKPVKRKAVKDAGSDDVGSEVAKSNKKAKMIVDLVVKENGAAQGGLELGEKVKSEAEEGWDAYPYCKEALEVESSGYYFKRCLDFNKIGAKKAKEMDDLCRAYHVKELELKSARVEVQEKITKLLHDTLKS